MYSSVRDYLVSGDRITTLVRECKNRLDKEKDKGLLKRIKTEGDFLIRVKILLPLSEIMKDMTVNAFNEVGAGKVSKASVWPEFAHPTSKNRWPAFSSRRSFEASLQFESMDEKTKKLIPLLFTLNSKKTRNLNENP